jgi:hypothetical protein
LYTVRAPPLPEPHFERIQPFPVDTVEFVDPVREVGQNPPRVLRVEEGCFRRVSVRRNVLQVVERPLGGFGEIGGEQRVAEEVPAQRIAFPFPMFPLEGRDRDQQNRFLRNLQEAMGHAPQEDFLREGFSVRTGRCFSEMYSPPALRTFIT